MNSGSAIGLRRGQQLSYVENSLHRHLPITHPKCGGIPDGCIVVQGVGYGGVNNSRLQGVPLAKRGNLTEGGC